MRNPEKFNLLPAYSRDYTSIRAITSDLQANKDFLICMVCNRYDGSYINLEQMVLGDSLQIRYKKQRSICVIEITQKILDERKNASSKSTYNHEYSPLK